MTSVRRPTALVNSTRSVDLIDVHPEDLDRVIAQVNLEPAGYEGERRSELHGRLRLALILLVHNEPSPAPWRVARRLRTLASVLAKARPNLRYNPKSPSVVVDRLQAAALSQAQRTGGLPDFPPTTQIVDDEGEPVTITYWHEREKVRVVLRDFDWLVDLVNEAADLESKRIGNASVHRPNQSIDYILADLVHMYEYFWNRAASASTDSKTSEAGAPVIRFVLAVFELVKMRLQKEWKVDSAVLKVLDASPEALRKRLQKLLRKRAARGAEGQVLAPAHHRSTS
jgi:hypothetical protein